MTDPNAPEVEDVVPTEEEDAKFANEPNGGGK